MVAWSKDKDHHVRRLASEGSRPRLPWGLQLKALRRHVRDTLSEVLDRLRWEGPPRRVVATSKTFKQLARLAGAPPQRKGPFVERTVNRSQLHEWVERLAAMDGKRRAQQPGVARSRAGQIVAGAVEGSIRVG